MEHELPALTETLTTYALSPALRGKVDALAATLSPAQQQCLAQIIAGTWEEGAEARQAELEAREAAILQHFPGIEPAWHVVGEHLENASHAPCIDIATATLGHERCKWYPPEA
jgi:predicted transcriptional regulator